jgi:diguanylate cyclase (GGDEF)-like protein
LAVSRDLALQLYFGFHVVSLFPVSIMFMKRRCSAKELQLANAKLTLLASRDGLTGIANRRAFDERCADEWNRAIRSHQPLGLVMIDIDHFKQFNDLYGHLAGDDCLRSVATSLARVLQRPEDLVARFGGEEFALLLPHTSHNGTRAIAEVLRNAVLDLEITHRGSPWNRVTVSIGFATVTPAPGELPAGLVHRADAALYRAKHLGRNRAETPSANEGDLQAA